MSTTTPWVNIVKYTLMHKDIAVAEIDLEDDLGIILNLGKIYNKAHFPIGTVRYGEVDHDLMKAWWNSRSIPASREKLESFLSEARIPSSKALLTKSMGLSLSDQYWIKPCGSELRWSDVNFFENDFSEDIGNLLFGHPLTKKIDLKSPDNTSDGVLKKRWKTIDGKRCLLKSGKIYLFPEVYNEVIASILCRALQIPHVDYNILSFDGVMVSVCEDFVDMHSEFVNAISVLNSYTYLGPMDYYMRYVNACSELGLDVVPFLDRMLVLDYIMENHDRHFGNFGILRDAETLEVLGPAPIFDTGSSLRCDNLGDQFWNQECKSKPFKDTFDEQIKLVRSFDWIDFDKLYKSLDEIENLLAGTPLDKWGAADDILELLDMKITKLKNIVDDR